MARPVQRTARKDYPNQKIAKGDTYWYVQIKTGPRSSRVMRQKEPFRRSQLTSSDYLQQLYAWEDSKGALAEMDSAQEFSDTIRALGEEQGEKFDNMPEGLQQGDTGQTLESRRDACESAAEEIDGIISEWEDAKSTWETEIEEYKTALAAYKKQEDENDKPGDPDAEEDDTADDKDELTKPDLPEHTRDNDDGDFEFDEDEFLERVKEVSVDD